MRAEDGLTPKQRRFVEEYLVDLNATAAAIRAGFSYRTANQIGPRLLVDVGVAAAIKEAKAKRSEETGITARRVVEELACVAFSDMRLFAQWGADGVSLRDSEQLPPDMARCVSEVSQTVTQHGGSIRFKLHNKVDALGKLLEHLGEFGDKSGSDFGDISKLTDDELESMRKKLRLVG